MVSSTDDSSKVTADLLRVQLRKYNSDDRLEENHSLEHKTNKSRQASQAIVQSLLSADNQSLDNILKLLNSDKEAKRKRLLGRYFSRLFNRQVVGLFTDSNENGEIALRNGKKFSRILKFEGEKCLSAQTMPADYKPHKVFIIDNPSIIDNFNINGSHAHASHAIYRVEQGSYVSRLLQAVYKHHKNLDEDISAGLSISEITEDEGKPIIDIMDKAYAERIEFDKEGIARISSHSGMSDRIYAANASMGVKAFSLLRYLIENSIVSNGDILVFDEPEIHLHPQWQVPYAHALLATAKLLGIKTIVTTHSPFFLKALVGYSQIEKFSDKTHYYTADENLDGPIEYRELNSDGIAALYREMAKPLMEIDQEVFDAGY